MSNTEYRLIRSKRLLQKQRHIKRQIGLKKLYLINAIDQVEPKVSPHFYHKKNSLNCGRPRCGLCGNPRRVYKEITFQEKKFFENADDQIKQTL
ncbi:hypothetical protein [Allochromatium vinosum]|uniref:hypothetical protein n=1 Tax=Allochromatium vinosum TaxID=1049 RepID=UPI0011D048A4|nr:hypothetical protein [Allochromatium vinosum]